MQTFNTLASLCSYQEAVNYQILGIFQKFPDWKWNSLSFPPPGKNSRWFPLNVATLGKILIQTGLMGEKAHTSHSKMYFG